MFVPSTNRLGSFTVTHWRPEEFKQCKGISADTPVNYREDGGDLRMSPETVTKVPRRRRASVRGLEAAPVTGNDYVDRLLDAKDKWEACTAHLPPPSEAEKATLAANATHIARGVKALEREGVAQFKTSAAADMRECQSEAETALLTTSPEIALQGSQTVEVVVTGPMERARTAALASGIGAIKTVDEAMASEWWPIFKARMKKFWARLVIRHGP